MVGFRLWVQVRCLLALLAVMAVCSSATVAQDTAEASAEPQADAPIGEPASEPADKPAEDQSAAEKPAEQKPAEQKPAEQKPAEERPADKPTETPAQASDAKEKEKEKAPAEEPPEQKPSGPASYPRLPGMGSVTSAPIPGTPWRVHDLFRPRPPTVTPGAVDSSKYLGTAAPSDAIVLFDGTDLSQWAHRDAEDPAVMYPARWKVQDGYMEVTPRSGSLYTIDSFGSCQLHIEWATPEQPRGSSQGRGNSGIKFFGLYEVQVLDSYDNRTYADGQAGAIYGQYPPDVNASRPPGEWQSYDILFNAPEFEGDQLVRPATVTVIHNGVALHHARELKGKTGASAPDYRFHPPAGQIMLQDHGNPTRFRNIWIRPLN